MSPDGTEVAGDQKTSIVEMCITGYGIMDNSIHNSIRQPVIHIPTNADCYGISLTYLFNFVLSSAKKAILFWGMRCYNKAIDKSEFEPVKILGCHRPL